MFVVGLCFVVVGSFGPRVSDVVELSSSSSSSHYIKNNPNNSFNNNLTDQNSNKSKSENHIFGVPSDDFIRWFAPTPSTAKSSAASSSSTSAQSNTSNTNTITSSPPSSHHPFSSSSSLSPVLSFPTLVLNGLRFLSFPIRCDSQYSLLSSLNAFSLIVVIDDAALSALPSSLSSSPSSSIDILSHFSSICRLFVLSLDSEERRCGFVSENVSATLRQQNKPKEIASSTSTNITTGGKGNTAVSANANVNVNNNLGSRGRRRSGNEVTGTVGGGGGLKEGGLLKLPDDDDEEEDDIHDGEEKNMNINRKDGGKGDSNLKTNEDFLPPLSSALSIASSPSPSSDSSSSKILPLSTSVSSPSSSSSSSPLASPPTSLHILLDDFLMGVHQLQSQIQSSASSSSYSSPLMVSYPSPVEFITLTVNQFRSFTFSLRLPPSLPHGDFSLLPYYSLLLLESPLSLLSSLSASSSSLPSSLLNDFISLSSPFLSLIDISIRLDLPIDVILSLSFHLTQWGKGKFIRTINMESCFVMSNNMAAAATSSLYRDMDRELLLLYHIHLTDVLSFITVSPHPPWESKGEKVKSLLLSALILLIQKGIVHQVEPTYILLLTSDGNSKENNTIPSEFTEGEKKIFPLMIPFLNGQYSLGNIQRGISLKITQEGIHHSADGYSPVSIPSTQQLREIINKLKMKNLVIVIQEGEGEEEEEEEEKTGR